MGIITEISKQRTRNRVNIFVDNMFKSGLEFETAVKFGLKVGKEVDDDELDQIIIESEVQSAFDVALGFLSLMPKSVLEVKQKLIRKGYSNIVIEKTLQKLEEYHYVDDFEYAKTYVASCLKKSKREIIDKLKKKGVSKLIIEEITNEIDDDFDFERANEYALKYLK